MTGTAAHGLARRARAAALVLAVPLAVLLAVLLAGCGAAEDGSVRDGGGAGDPSPEVGSSATFDTFVVDAGLEDLPRGEVLLRRAGASADEVALRVAVVIADTPQARSRGLMEVAEVPDGIGMLFVFPEPAGPEGRPGFWMLDTPVALDIAFAADGRIVGVATMRPCPGPPCPVTHPGVEYDVALEVREGALRAAGIGPGDRLEHR